MTQQLIQSINSPQQVNYYYKVIHNAIGGCINDGQLWLIKRAEWVIAIAHIEIFYSREGKTRIAQTLLNFGYPSFIAAALSKVTETDYAPILVIPSTDDGIDDFICDYFSWYWYVFFSGNPDWFILPAQTLDFMIIAGQPDFVNQVLGCEPHEASMDIREMSEVGNFEPPVRKYYAHLLEQIQMVYLQAEPGTIINLGLVDWQDQLQ